MSLSKKIVLGLAVAITVSSIYSAQTFAEENIFGAIQVDEAVVTTPPPSNLPLENPVILQENLPSSVQPLVNIKSKERKLEDAMINVESAQADMRNELTQIQAKYADIDNRYKSIKNQRKIVKKQLKEIKKQLKSLDSAKKKIRKNMVEKTK